MTGRGIEVIAPGPLSTIQDRGRHGMQHLGFSPSGAVDLYAAEIGNLLLDNDPAAAAVEITLGDAAFRLRGDSLFAVTGADAPLYLNDHPIEPWRAYAGRDGSVVHIGRARAGVRLYLCAAGGVAVPASYGSRSTDLVARIGGHEGRALRVGDMLPLGAAHPGARPGRHLAPVSRPLQHGVRFIRAVPGPQQASFTDEGERRLFGSIYRVSSRADRTGLYLDGPRLSHARRPDVLSEGVTAGSIQVPGDGHPLVLLAEHRSVGGYAKIATVCAADLACLGQAGPGDRILFARGDHAAAQTAYRAFRRMCGRSDESSLAPATSGEPSLPLDEWLDAVDKACARDIADVRLPLLRSDLRTLLQRVSRKGHEGGWPACAPSVRIQTIAPDKTFPAMRARAEVTGTLLMLDNAATSIPAGTIVGGVWSPGELTLIVAMHPLASYQSRYRTGQWVRMDEAVLAGAFVEAVAVLSGGDGVSQRIDEAS